MTDMFNGATDFNQDLTSWSVVDIASTGPTDFNTGSAMDSDDLPIEDIIADTTAPTIAGDGNISVSENSTVAYTFEAAKPLLGQVRYR